LIDSDAEIWIGVLVVFSKVKIPDDVSKYGVP
jgi:hypothetical protein